jgi:predicted nucleic acid-binding protein
VSIFFADTSAIAKQYLVEPGSAWVQSWASRSAGNIIIISRLTTVEFISGLARRQREGTISLSDFSVQRGAFLDDTDKFYLTIDVDEPVLILARDLVAKHSLRALDGIQLASAIFAETALSIKFTFVSSDRQQLTAATAEGFAVDDPNLHP